MWIVLLGFGVVYECILSWKNNPQLLAISPKSTNTMWTAEFILLILAYLVAFGYIFVTIPKLSTCGDLEAFTPAFMVTKDASTSDSNQRRRPRLLHQKGLVKSKYGLAFTIIFVLVLSFIMTIGICKLFSDLKLYYFQGGIFWEALPFIILVIGVENSAVMVSSIANGGDSDNILTDDISIPERVGIGLRNYSKKILFSLCSQWALTMSGCLIAIPSLQEFCLFTSIAIAIDFSLQIMLLVPALSLDLRRLELMDLDMGRMNVVMNKNNTSEIGASSEEPRPDSKYQQQDQPQSWLNWAFAKNGYCRCSLREMRDSLLLNGVVTVGSSVIATCMVVLWFRHLAIETSAPVEYLFNVGDDMEKGLLHPIVFAVIVVVCLIMQNWVLLSFTSGKIRNSVSGWIERKVKEKQYERLKKEEEDNDGKKSNNCETDSNVDIEFIAEPLEKIAAVSADFLRDKSRGFVVTCANSGRKFVVCGDDFDLEWACWEVRDGTTPSDVDNENTTDIEEFLLGWKQNVERGEIVFADKWSHDDKSYYVFAFASELDMMTTIHVFDYDSGMLLGKTDYDSLDNCSVGQIRIVGINTDESSGLKSMIMLIGETLHTWTPSTSDESFVHSTALFLSSSSKTSQPRGVDLFEWDKEHCQLYAVLRDAEHCVCLFDLNELMITDTSLQTELTPVSYFQHDTELPIRSFNIASSQLLTVHDNHTRSSLLLNVFDITLQQHTKTISIPVYGQDVYFAAPTAFIALDTIDSLLHVCFLNTENELIRTHTLETKSCQFVIVSRNSQQVLGIRVVQDIKRDNPKFWQLFRVDVSCHDDRTVLRVFVKRLVGCDEIGFADGYNEAFGLRERGQSSNIQKGKSDEDMRFVPISGEALVYPKVRGSRPLQRVDSGWSKDGDGENSEESTDESDESSEDYETNSIEQSDEESSMFSTSSEEHEVARTPNQLPTPSILLYDENIMKSVFVFV